MCEQIRPWHRYPQRILSLWLLNSKHSEARCLIRLSDCFMRRALRKESLKCWFAASGNQPEAPPRCATWEEKRRGAKCCVAASPLRPPVPCFGEHDSLQVLGEGWILAPCSPRPLTAQPLPPQSPSRHPPSVFCLLLLSSGATAMGKIN